MKMILETVSFCPILEGEKLLSLLGREVEYIPEYFSSVSTKSSTGLLEARLFLVTGEVVHGTVLYVDNGGYPL